MQYRRLKRLNFDEITKIVDNTSMVDRKVLQIQLMKQHKQIERTNRIFEKKGNIVKHHKGVKAGNIQKCLFEETKVGFLLMLQAPIEYKVLMRSTPCVFGNQEPTADTIEVLSLCSNNPLFSTTLFKKALLKYKKLGLYPVRTKRVTKTNYRFHMSNSFNRINSMYLFKSE